MRYTDFISRLTVTGKTSDGVLAVCPAHEDRPDNPHLRVTVTDHGKLLLHCRVGCANAKVIEALGLTLRDIATVDCSDAPADVHSAAAKTPATGEHVARLAVQLDEWAAAFDADSLAYVGGRFGLTADDAARLGLGSTFTGGARRVVVPFRTPQGVARGYQGRDLDGTSAVKWLGPKNPEGFAWSRMAWLPGSTDWNEVLVTEGPGDGLTAAGLGYDVISIAGAAGVNATNADEIVDWVRDRPVVICGDGDGAGASFNATLAALLVDRGVTVRILDVPQGLDLSDWRKQEGEGFVRVVTRALAEAKPLAATEAALLKWDEARFSLTELGAARYLLEFIRSKGTDVRFTPETGFLIVEHGVWRRDAINQVRTWAQEVADVVRDITAKVTASSLTTPEKSPERQAAGRWGRFAALMQSGRGLTAVTSEMKSLPGVGMLFTAFDQHNNLIAFRNGVVDLRTGLLRPHDPSLLLSKSFHFDYDPEATAPTWVRFLEEAHNDKPDFLPYVKKLFGYGITGETSEAAFVVHYGGKGGNGKSTCLNALADVAEDFTVITPFSTFEERASGGIPNDLAALKGARFVFASEGNAGKPMDEAKLKSATGGDIITARFLNREFFSFKPSFLLHMASNFKPKFKGQDGGLWRRVKMIHWNRSFTEEGIADHDLPAKLRAEAQGIATWLVQGAVSWYREGLGDPTWVQAATKEYRETSDALAGFFPGAYVRDEHSRVDGATLYASYKAWAEAEGLPAREVWTRTMFYSALSERGLVQRKTNKGAAFDGVRRASEADLAKAAAEEAAELAAEAAPAAPVVDEVPAAPAAPVVTGLSTGDLYMPARVDY